MVSKKARNLAIKLAASDEFSELLNMMQYELMQQWGSTVDREAREELYVKFRLVDYLDSHIEAIARGDKE